MFPVSGNVQPFQTCEAFVMTIIVLNGILMFYVFLFPSADLCRSETICHFVLKCLVFPLHKDDKLMQPHTVFIP